MADKQFKVDLNMTGNKITNLADPSAGTDGVNLNYLTNFVQGRTYKEPARVASTANLNLASPGASVDGVSLSNGDRVLVRAQSSGAENGIYLFNGSAAVMTRTTDADSSAEVKSGLAIQVNEGSTWADKQFVLTTDGTIILGTTVLTFTNVNAGGTTYTADGSGIELVGTQFQLELDGTTLSKSASGVRIGSGAAGNGLVESSGVLAVNPGAGITITSDAVVADTSLMARWKSATAGNGASTTLTLTHNLGNAFHIAQVQDATSGEVYEVKIVKGSNSTTFEFQVAPTTNSVVLIAVG